MKYRILIVLILAAITLIAMYSGSSINTATESGVIMKLPMMVNDFMGKDVQPSEGERMLLPKDTEFEKKIYLNSEGEQLNATIVLAGAEKRSIHRPEVCLPAQGWTIDRRITIPVKLSNGLVINVMADFIERPVVVNSGDKKMLQAIYCYWFIGKDIITSSHATRILLTSWDRLVHHKNHRWAYVSISAPVLEGFKPGGKNVIETEKMLIDFIAEVAPSVIKMENFVRVMQQGNQVQKL